MTLKVRVGTFEEATSMAVLRSAYEKERVRKGPPGADKVTVAAFGRRLQQNLEDLQAELRDGYYRCRPIVRFHRPKKKGGLRPLGICTVRDRIVQRAVAEVLTPIWEHVFSDNSHAYRPGRSTMTALRQVDLLREFGNTWAFRADIEDCFASVHAELLEATLQAQGVEREMRALVLAFLKAGVLEHGVVSHGYLGLPQGSPISPLLANIYLHPFDDAMEEAGFAMIRYADDFVVLAKNRAEAERAQAVAVEVLTARGMRPSPEKSHICRCDKGMTFLGFVFDKQGRGPAIRAVDSLEARLGALHQTHQNAHPARRIELYQQVLRGWWQYFGSFGHFAPAVPEIGLAVAELCLQRGDLKLARRFASEIAEIPMPELARRRDALLRSCERSQDAQTLPTPFNMEAWCRAKHQATGVPSAQSDGSDAATGILDAATSGAATRASVSLFDDEAMLDLLVERTHRLPSVSEEEIAEDTAPWPAMTQLSEADAAAMAAITGPVRIFPWLPFPTLRVSEALMARVGPFALPLQEGEASPDAERILPDDASGASAPDKTYPTLRREALRLRHADAQVSLLHEIVALDPEDQDAQMSLISAQLSHDRMAEADGTRRKMMEVEENTRYDLSSVSHVPRPSGHKPSPEPVSVESYTNQPFSPVTLSEGAEAHFLTLFRGRPGVLAEALDPEQTASTSLEYRPVVECLDLDKLRSHLSGQRCLAIYPLLEDGRAHLAAIDIDLAKPFRQAHAPDSDRFLHKMGELHRWSCALASRLRSFGLATLFEDSGNKGRHIWIFLKQPMPAKRLRVFLTRFLQEQAPAPQQVAYELFPDMDGDPGNDAGPPLKLPLGQHPRSGCASRLLPLQPKGSAAPEGLLLRCRPSSPATIDAWLLDRKAGIGLTLMEDRFPLCHRLMRSCLALRRLIEKAEAVRHLTHHERTTLLFSFGLIPKEGPAFIHAAISLCHDYKPEVTERHIQWLFSQPAKPISCPRIRDKHGDLLDGTRCQCLYRSLPEGCYPTPLLQVLSREQVFPATSKKQRNRASSHNKGAKASTQRSRSTNQGVKPLPNQAQSISKIYHIAEHLQNINATLNPPRPDDALDVAGTANSREVLGPHAATAASSPQPEIHTHAAHNDTPPPASRPNVEQAKRSASVPPAAQASHTAHPDPAGAATSLTGGPTEAAAATSEEQAPLLSLGKLSELIPPQTKDDINVLLRQFIERRRNLRGLQSSLDRVVATMEEIFDKAGVEMMDTQIGRLHRITLDDGSRDWCIEL